MLRIQSLNQFSSVQDGIPALGKAHLRSTPFVRPKFPQSSNQSGIDDAFEPLKP